MNKHTKRLIEEAYPLYIGDVVNVIKDTYRINKVITLEEEALRIKSLSHSVKIEREKSSYPVFIDFIRSNLGATHGFVFMFVCPSCGSFHRYLYFLHGSSILKCRDCHNLVYKSQKESDKRINKLLKDPILFNEFLSSNNLTKNLLALKTYIKKLSLISRLVST